MNQDSLSMYLNEIRNIPLLSADEEASLVKEAAGGNKAARNKLVESNLRFVVKIAKEYVNRGIEFEDLIDEGNAGLIQAVNHFDPNAGVKFISYAVWWIRQSIMKALYEFGHEIRLPMNRANELVNIEKARKLIGESKSEAAQAKEIADLKKQLDAAKKAGAESENQAKKASADLASLRSAYDELRKAKPLPELDFPNFPVSENDSHVVVTKVEGEYVSIEWDEEGKIVIIPYWFWQKLNDYDHSVVDVKTEYGRLLEQSRRATPAKNAK